VWNRKRANALVVLEILLCFIVVFGVLVFGVAMADNLRQPLGYSTTDVWDVEFGRELDAAGDPKAGEVIDRLLQVARGLAPVEAVAANLVTPYSTAAAVTNTWAMSSVAVLNANETARPFTPPPTTSPRCSS